MSTITAARRTRRRVPLPVLATSLALIAGGVSALSAQGHPAGSGHLVALGGASTPGTTSVSPRSGPVGTLVKLVPQNLPPDKAVQLMMGALRDGFEVVRLTRTDDVGRIDGRDTVIVKVPDWVKTDRAYLVMVTDTLYNPLAAADMFHPTDANGGLSRRGKIKLDEPTCPILTAEGGEIYVLVGNTAGLTGGGEVIVDGTVIPPGRCGKLTTIQVARVRPPPN